MHKPLFNSAIHVVLNNFNSTEVNRENIFEIKKQ